MQAIMLLTISNVFMTLAWYGHLKYRQAPLGCLKEPLRWNHAVGFMLIIAAVLRIVQQQGSIPFTPP